MGNALSHPLSFKSSRDLGLQVKVRRTFREVTWGHDYDLRLEQGLRLETGTGIVTWERMPTTHRAPKPCIQLETFHPWFRSTISLASWITSCENFVKPKPSNWLFIHPLSKILSYYLEENICNSRQRRKYFTNRKWRWKTLRSFNILIFCLCKFSHWPNRSHSIGYS